MEWTELIGQFMNFSLFGGFMWMIKKLVDRVEKLGTRVTVLETEHNFMMERGVCPRVENK